MDYDSFLRMSVDGAGLSSMNFELSFEPDGPEPRWYCTTENNSVELILSEDRLINTVFIKVSSGASAFRGIDGRSRRKDVRALLGVPSQKSQDSLIDFVTFKKGKRLEWDRFDTKAVCIHVQYTKGTDQVGMITLMTPESAP